MFSFRFFSKVLYALILAVLTTTPVVSQASTVRLLTALGPIDIALYDTEAPLTVANFLSYVNSSAYNNSFIHRSVPGFIIQGGGYTWNSEANKVATIPALAPVQNEFSATRSNVRGTIAMAKVGNDPNSATSQWFINLADNSLNLDNQNGGFTVFGQVTAGGMQVVDAIAALSTVNAGGTFTNLPILSPPTSGSLQQGDLAMVMSTVTRSDCLFNWAEQNYAQYFSPAGATSATYTPYYYRYYSSTGNYLAVSSNDDHIWVLGPGFGNNLLDVGPVTNFLSVSGCP